MIASPSFFGIFKTSTLFYLNGSSERLGYKLSIDLTGYCYFLLSLLSADRKMFIFILTLLLITIETHHIDYPIRFTYVNHIETWWPQNSLLEGLGVPGYGSPSRYNYMAFSFWTSNKGPMDAAEAWNNPLKYLSSNN